MSLEKLEEMTHRLAELDGFIHDAINGGLSAAGKWSWNIETDELKWDQQMHRLFDSTEADFSGCVGWFIDHLHPGDRERIGVYLYDCVRNGLSYAATYRTHAGRRIHAYGSISGAWMSGVCLPQPECTDG